MPLQSKNTNLTASLKGEFQGQTAQIPQNTVVFGASQVRSDFTMLQRILSGGQRGLLPSPQQLTSNQPAYFPALPPVQINQTPAINFYQLNSASPRYDPRVIKF